MPLHSNCKNHSAYPARKKQINFFPILNARHHCHWLQQKSPPSCPRLCSQWVARAQVSFPQRRASLRSACTMNPRPPSPRPLPPSLPCKVFPLFLRLQCPSALFPPCSLPPSGSPQPPPTCSSSSHSHLKLLP